MTSGHFRDLDGNQYKKCDAYKSLDFWLWVIGLEPWLFF